MTAFAESGVTGIIELSPAGTLTGLAKRALRGTPTVAVKTPDDLTAATALLDSATADASGSPAASPTGGEA
jgi:[acyl-carrier-protein] S-malonyltransferase